MEEGCARALKVACGLGRPGREREEWAGAGLTWVGFWLGFGLSGFWVLFLISISLLSKSNSNIV